MTVRLELARLEQLREVLGGDVPALVAGVLANLERELGHLESALAAGELEPVVKAAHACRNDALIVGASELLAALTGVEQAAQAGELGRARELRLAVARAWPGTREALSEAANGRDGLTRGPSGGP